ncbi:hypothetical protein N2152v2_008045 [Parachlorella kessleri]
MRYDAIATDAFCLAVLAGHAITHGPALPGHSIAFLVALSALSLLDHLWHRWQPVTHAAWASLLTLLVNVGIICNPLSWAVGYSTCKKLGNPASGGGTGWDIFALGLLWASHGLCLAIQGLGRRLSGFWPQAAQQALLVALAMQNNVSVCSQLQLDLPSVREQLQRGAAHLQTLALLPTTAPLGVPWVNSLPGQAQCRAVLLFWQLSLGIVLPLSLQLRRCQVMRQQRATAAQAVPQGQAAGHQPRDAAAASSSRVVGDDGGSGSGAGRGSASTTGSGSRGWGPVMDETHVRSPPGADGGGEAARQQAQPHRAGAPDSTLGSSSSSSSISPRMLLCMAVQLVAAAWLVSVGLTQVLMVGDAASEGNPAGPRMDCGSK